MKLFINSNNEIKDVNSTIDENLTLIEVSDDNNPFSDWSTVKICCFKVEVNEDGQITMFTPYVDSNVIEYIDKLDKLNTEQIIFNADILYQLSLLQLSITDENL